jgi:hypothetical protein
MHELIKCIEMDILDLTWIVEVEYYPGNGSSDPQVEDEMIIYNFYVNQVLYDNGWHEFDPDTVQDLAKKHHSDILQNIKTYL